MQVPVDGLLSGPRDVETQQHLNTSLNRVVRGGMLGIGGLVLGAALNLVLVVVVTRALGTEGAGVFFESVALFTILVTVAAFGADTGFVRGISRTRALNRVDELRWTLRAGLVPVTALSVLFAAAIAIYAPELVDLFYGDAAGRSTRYLRMLAPFVPFATIAWVLVAASRGFGSMVPYVMLENVAKPLLRPILAMAAVAAGLGAGAIAIAWAVPVLIELPLAAMFVVSALRRLEGGNEGSSGDTRPPREIVAEFWRFSFPRAIASSFQVVIMWSDILLVGILLGPAEAGIYAVVSRLTLVGKLVLEGIRLAIAPEISGLLSRGVTDEAGRLYRLSTVWTIMFSWPFYLVLFLFAPVILQIFGPDFVAGADALEILCVAMLFDLGTGAVTVVLLMGGKSSWNLANSTIAVVANIGLNLVLIPRFGIVGAAVAWFVSILCQNLIPLVEIGLLMKIRLFSSAYLRIVLGVVACFGVVPWVVRDVVGVDATGLVMGVLAGTLAYAVFVFGVRHALELPLLWSSLRRRRSRPERTEELAPAGAGTGTV